MSEQEELMKQMRKEMNDMNKGLKSLQKKISIWQMIFTREFVAVFVGAILLIIFASFLMVAMYKNIQTTEVIANGFFVVLGFFFSQTATGMSSQNDGTDEMLQKMKTKMDKVEGIIMLNPENEVSKQIHRIMEAESI